MLCWRAAIAQALRWQLDGQGRLAAGLHAEPCLAVTAQPFCLPVSYPALPAPPSSPTDARRLSAISVPSVDVDVMPSLGPAAGLGDDEQVGA